ncbi:MAG: hypothetical protein ABJF04_13320 [Reichenbachiella sp.]|uniref:hypothetical protein n=1 Tax=Reichenbachiella sp. TaxID=2184521 RepID=UPI0032649033
MSIKELIVVHVCYRDVFNAPVSIEALKTWLGVGRENHQMFDTALAELKNEGLMIEAKGFLARKGNEEVILNQKRKSELAEKITAKGQKGLTLLSKMPFIKFVGISGSIAAENPTYDFDEKHVDLDLFVVTSKNTLWCFILVERIFTNIVRLFQGNHFYCLNYVTEDSFLEIYNKNFYTATELINLRPIIDKGVFSKLICCNQWVDKYYNKESKESISASVFNKSFSSSILFSVNYLFFILFGLMRSLKRFDLIGIRDLKTTFDPNQRFNFLRISNERGGYQEAIKKKFGELFKDNFKDYYSEALMEELFPAEHSFVFSPDSQIEDFKMKQLFRKYTLLTDEKGSG